MNVSKQQSRERFKKYYFEFPELGLAEDLSRMDVSDEFLRDAGTANSKSL